MSVDAQTMRALGQIAERDPQLAQRVLMYRLATPARPKNKPPQHVYFIRAEHSGLIKIGCATNPTARLRALSTGSAEPLKLLAVWQGGGRDAERQMHELFAPYRSHGEWFHPSEELYVAIRACTR